MKADSRNGDEPRYTDGGPLHEPEAVLLMLKA